MNFLKKGLIAVLIIAIGGIILVGCKKIDLEENQTTSENFLPKQKKPSGTTFTRIYVPLPYNDCYDGGNNCSDDVVVSGIQTSEAILLEENGVKNFFLNPDYESQLGFPIDADKLEELTSGNYQMTINTNNGNRVWVFSTINNSNNSDDFYCAIRVSN